MFFLLLKAGGGTSCVFFIVFHVFYWTIFFFGGASARYSSCFSGVCRTSLVSRRVNDCLKNRCCNVNLKICQGAQSSQQTLGDISEESLVRGRDLAARDVK